MNEERKFVINAVTSLLLLGIIASSGWVYAAAEEKFCGVAKAGQNASNRNKIKHYGSGH